MVKGHGGRGTKQTKFHKAALPGMGRTNVRKPGSAFKNSNASTKLGRTSDPSKDSVKAGGKTRSKNTLKRLEMYRAKAPNKRDLHKQESKPMRIEADRRWFGNTRVIGQNKMQQFREELTKDLKDPYQVVLKTSKLPLQLLKDSETKGKMDLLGIEAYADTFGSKKKRNKPKLGEYDLAGLMSSVAGKHKEYAENQETGIKSDKQIKFDLGSGFEKGVHYEGHDNEEVFLKGTSKRIWRELYKVVDSADVLLHVIDARDPIGTRCTHLEKQIAKNHPNKHVVLILNKCDLIPNWATKRWVEHLRKEKPTLAFHASVTNPFGKAALIELLRQFSRLMKDKKQIQIGLIGYPNVGKSSVINTLKRKAVCKAAPVPGETKVWQYIALSKKIYAIDCPGIVPLTAVDFKSDSAKVLKGVVRAEKLESPSAYIDEVVSRVKPKYLYDKYNLSFDITWKDGEEFLEKLAKKMGKLKKGGEPDIETAARIVLYDWQRGRIPYFVAPPDNREKKEEKEEEEDAEKAEDEVEASGEKKTEVSGEKKEEKSSRRKSTASDKATSVGDASEHSDSGESAQEEEKDTAESNDKKSDKTAKADDDNKNPFDKKKLVLPKSAIPEQDFSTVKTAHEFDLQDQRIGEISPSQQRQHADKMKKLKRAKELEREMAMNSDESDVEELDVQIEARKAGDNRRQNAEKEKKDKISIPSSKKNKKRGREEEEEDNKDDNKGDSKGGDNKKGNKKGNKKQKGSGLGSGLDVDPKFGSSNVDWAKAMEEFNTI